MDTNTGTWILLALILVACCVLPMFFMGRHRRMNGRGNMEKPEGQKMDVRP